MGLFRPLAVARAAPAALVLFACLPGAPIHSRAAEEVRRGYAHLQSGDAERAEVAFEHALAFNPDLPEALNGLGVVERRRGRIEPARQRFEEALAADPDFAEAHVNLGESWMARGRDDLATAEFLAALGIDPDMLTARLDLARSLLHQGRVAEPARRGALWSRARREYLHLLETRPGLVEAHHDLAFMDYESGAYARAEGGYRKAAQLDPKSAEALHGLCISLVRQNRCAEGAAACRRCLESAPGTPQCQKSLVGALACSR